LLAVTDIARRAELAAQVLSNDWSVRELERQVQATQKPPTVSGGGPSVAGKEPTARDANVADLEKQLADYLGTRVKLQLGRKKGSGRLVLDFYTLDQFDGLMQKIGFGGR
jgi:ParB-like chromosome segregation protein Spo0J